MRKKELKIEHWHVIAFLMIIYDAVMVNLSYFAALWIRFDCAFSQITNIYLSAWMRFVPIYTVFCIAVFLLLRLYNSMWRYASYDELMRVIVASIITAVFHIIAITAIFQRMPISYYIFGALVQFAFVLGIRFSYRLALVLKRFIYGSEQVDHIMLVGAGSAGQLIMRDIHSAEKIHEKVVCIIDDNPNKWHRYIDGVPVVGGRDSILKNVVEYDVDKIYLAIPSATAEERRDILNICKETDCELKNLPGMYQFVAGDISVKAMKDVSIEDLLGREPIHADMSESFELIHGKTVMVTGGGGSIGSELCRQVAAHGPRQLIVFDIYENNAYEIQLELKEKYPDLNLVTLIGSVRDSRRMFQVFEEYKPQIVYHAAAHKHVPLMEDSPNEAIKNNPIGTYKTAYAAMIHGCERFVLISTDKAVNPTNIMGASKRLCEMIIQSFDSKIKAGKAHEIPQLFTHFGKENADKDGSGRAFQNIKTEFVAVRFGNVLGSNGSVVPIFKKQIEKGGPVTVTHPDVIRYFMTVPEAVSLVMLAGTYAKGGEIFVLDMGSPVKIDALARNLIKLSGFKPNVDIKIEYTGLRPGEKLYEEKLMAEEGLKKTKNDLIFIGCPIPFETDPFLKKLDYLMEAAYANRKDIRTVVADMVSTYHPADNPLGAKIDSGYKNEIRINATYQKSDMGFE